MEIWDGMDMNGNGHLSLAEVDKGLRDIIACDDIFDCKPAIMRAFQATKKAVKTTNPHGDDYIQKKEFRLLLQFLREYFEFYEAFDRVDTEDDRRINLEEFEQAVPMMEKWVGPIEDAEEAF